MGKIFTTAKLKNTYAEIKVGLNKSLEEGRQIVKEKTPEDTFELSKSIQTQKAVRTGQIVSGEINIDPNSEANEYVDYVEYGVPSGAERNYYKNSGRRRGGTPFKTSSTGARMFSGSVDEIKKIIINNLK